jgi:hypothetical protein
MLANLRRKIGLATRAHTPQPMNPTPANADAPIIVSSNFVDTSPLPPLTIEELGLTWPSDGGIFSPSSIPVWLQEQVRVFIPSCFSTFLSYDCGLPES